MVPVTVSMIKKNSEMVSPSTLEELKETVFKFYPGVKKYFSDKTVEFRQEQDFIIPEVYIYNEYVELPDESFNKDIVKNLILAKLGEHKNISNVVFEEDKFSYAVTRKILIVDLQWVRENLELFSRCNFAIERGETKSIYLEFDLR